MNTVFLTRTWEMNEVKKVSLVSHACVRALLLFVCATITEKFVSGSIIQEGAKCELL